MRSYPVCVIHPVAGRPQIWSAVSSRYRNDGVPRAGIWDTLTRSLKWSVLMIPFCRRTYQPRILGSSGKIMMPADLNALHKYMMEIEGISVISDEVPTVAPQMNFLTLRHRHRVVLISQRCPIATVSPMYLSRAGFGSRGGEQETIRRRIQ